MEACPGCGARLAGAGEGCQQLFDALSVSITTDPRLNYRVRRLAVDCYCLQHPDRYCVSAKSLAAHLTGLCWAIEYNGGERGLAQLQSWLNGNVKLLKPSLPTTRGSVSVVEVSQRIGELGGSAVDGWANEIWGAYAHLQSIARHWVEDATKRA